MSAAKIPHIRQALSIALSKPAPDSIPLSVPEKVRARDYYTVMFELEDDDRGFLVDALNADEVSGRWVSRFTDPELANIAISDLVSMQFEIRQYLAELEIHYDSPREFNWHQRLAIPKIKLLRERTTNRMYSRKLLLRANRMDILRSLLEHEIEDQGRVSVMTLMTQLHGRRWPVHPQALSNYQYTELLLKSLVNSDDLENDNGGYRVRPKAIETIVRHDVEDRRHRDNGKLQKWVIGLTIVVAIIGAIQAYAAAVEAGLFR